MEHYTWTTGTGECAEVVWYGTTNDPEIVECCCFELYDYEDYVGIMHAVLAMELGLDEL